MSNALDTYTLEHYLDFISDGTGMIQIDEPQGFDAANFIVKQDKDRYGRDVSFSGEKADYVFVNKDNLFASPFPLLNEYDKIYGFESEVKYVLRENGVDYVIGEIDFKNKTNDLVREFKCTVIQDTEQAQLKRRIKTKVNLFSDEDLNGDAITPVATSNILLKAKPIIQESEWFVPTPLQLFIANTAGSESEVFNAINGIRTAEIEDTLSWIMDINTDGEDLKLIEAKSNLTDVKLKIENVNISIVSVIGSTDINLRYKIGETWSGSSPEFIADLGTGAVVDFSIEMDLPNIPLGQSLWVYFINPDTNTGIKVVSFDSGTINVVSTATAIDSVTEGVRLIDVMRQVVKSINPLFTINAPRFDVGGEHYDNFEFNGNLIRGRKDDDGNNVPFVVTWQDITKMLPEMNADYEIKGTEIFVGHESDFYPNTEIGVFEQSPDGTFQMTYNERFTINEYNFKYKKFNQDKDDENTIDGVHAESENNVPNTRVENTKKVDVEPIRDPFMLETTRKKAVEVKGTTSLSQDDSIFVSDVAPLAPGSTSGFTSPITHYVNDDGDLQLLNDGTYSWNLLGFGIGDAFNILDTDNIGSYTVLLLEPNIITLTGGSPTSIGLKLTEVIYPLTNVQFVIRTNEGFDLIENILAPTEFGNLRYTIKRNIINYWGSYLKTATRFNPDIIRNTYFKNGGNLVTQLMGGDIIEEKANIEQSELTDSILTPNIITTKVLCNFTTYRELQENIKAEIIAGTRGGFIRIFDNNLRVRKGYVKTSDYSLSTGELELTLEEKFESEFTNIRKEFSTYIIDEVGYPQDLVPVLEYRTDGDYIQLFDSITRPLTNRTRYDFMTVNDVAFDNITDLAIAISAL